MSSIIPENKKGKALDLEQSVTKSGVPEAVSLFNLAAGRLLQPGSWHELTGSPGATFIVKDAKQNTLKRPVAVGDYIQIDIPAPGHDWVQVESIKKNFDPSANESLALTLMVSENPVKNDEKIEHFFSEGATSSFILKRTGNIVAVSYHGRNETPNTDNLRHTIIALGAIAGLSDLQWTALLKGLLQEKDDQ